jgi:hypothetical protein
MNKNFVDEVGNIVRDYVYKNINLSMVARVTNVDDYQSDQMIDVQPLVNTFEEDNESIQFDVIPSVIVCLQEGGGALISLPVKVGDKVRLEFSKQGLDNYLLSLGDSPLPPSDKRRFAITDCFATLGCPTVSTNLHPNPDDLEIKFADSSFKMKPNGNLQVDVNGDYIENISGNKITNVSGTIAQNTSSITQNGIEIGEQHYHEQDNDSDGNTQQDTEVVFR